VSMSYTGVGVSVEHGYDFMVEVSVLHNFLCPSDNKKYKFNRMSKITLNLCSNLAQVNNFELQKKGVEC